MIQEEFRLLFACPICSTPCEAWIDAPRVDPEALDPSAAKGEFEVLCSHCGETCDVWVTAEPGGWTATIFGAGEVPVAVEHLDYQYDNWLGGLAPEPHPYVIFREAISDWRALLARIGDLRSGSAGTNRMLMVQLFAILEAYLSDEVIRLASSDQEARTAIVSWDGDLRKREVLLTRVAAEPQLVKLMVVDRLRQTQFHRFEAVDRLLMQAIGHRFLPDDATDRSLMMQSVYVRHHCVHRNGRGETGRIVDHITVEYLERLQLVFSRSVSLLAEQLEMRRSNQRLQLLLKEELPF